MSRSWVQNCGRALKWMIQCVVLGPYLPMSTLRPPNIIHVMNAPRPSLFFCWSSTTMYCCELHTFHTASDECLMKAGWKHARGCGTVNFQMKDYSFGENCHGKMFLWPFIHFESWSTFQSSNPLGQWLYTQLYVHMCRCPNNTLT